MTKKASARGKRKSIVEQYKAKAKGTPGKKKKPVKRKKATVVKKKEKLMEMTVGEQTYRVGDVAHYVCEYNASPSRPKTNQGELTDVHPKDNIEPAVGLRDYETGKHRVIRARLIGWSKKEALANYKEFLKDKKKKK
tara:strand:- start:142 stop:552 length:411 start_codon:yes stop_codon:yes gene_type:complete